MRKLLLATIAAAALSLPAMAQNSANQPSSQNPPPQQMTPSSQQSTGSRQHSQLNNQQAQNTINPQQLSPQQIQQIQQALNKQGFDAGHVDGKWGSDTDKAVKDFQQKQNMQASGKLDQQTLQALGVNMTAQGPNANSQGPSTTGQGSNEDLSPSNSAPNATGGSGQNGAPSNQVNQH
jgi:peptidoglycan hydrolase-like protein with peptidoglycan-binding domain